jgi:hypothetical protein
MNLAKASVVEVPPAVLPQAASYPFFSRGEFVNEAPGG